METTKKQAIHTEKAPAAIGPYSQAIACGDWVFTSGQIALDPATGKLVEGDIVAQTKRVFQNLLAVLEEAGLGPENIVKTTVFLDDMNDFAAMNEVYATIFPEGACPARSAVEVAKLPKGSLVEIEAIAHR